MNLRCVVDSPAKGSAQYRQRIPVEGWIHADYRHGQLKRISAHAPAPHGEIGASTHFYFRQDVADALKLGPEVHTGFRFVATLVQPPAPTSPTPEIPIEIRAEFADGTITPVYGLTIKVYANDYTTAAYGDLCNPQKTAMLRREHIYASGQPAETASPECVKLLGDYLAPGASVIDVGCGVGAYCDPIRKLQHAWLGCETSMECLHRLALLSRPHRQIKLPRLPWTRYRLPAADGEFDAALVIEVLEHIRQPDSFLREVARVTRKQAFFSVPNCETLPYLSRHLAAPWHLLEGDHVNFFNRYNLRPLLAKHFRSVEILDYGRQPLASAEGLPLPYHLFAICEV